MEQSAAPGQPRGLGALSSVVIDREVGDWHRFQNRRQAASYTGLCPGKYSSGSTRVQSCGPSTGTRACVPRWSRPPIRLRSGQALAAGSLPAHPLVDALD